MKITKENDNILWKMKSPVVLYEEGLSYPWVHYPSSSAGAFIGFSKNRDSKIVFCECFRKSFENFIELGNEYRTNREKYTIGSGEYKLEKSVFPYDYVETLTDKQLFGKRFKNRIKFKEGLCHKCNQTVPSVRVPMAGMSKFEQHYTWYIQKKLLEIGYISCKIFQETLPDDLKEMVMEMRYFYQIAFEEEVELSEKDSAKKKYYKISKEFNKIIENMVREEFGYKKVGEHWVTETILYNLVRQIFLGKEVIFHYRPQILEGLELDIFIPELKLGIEYQGIQHYEPIEIWGGVKSLQRTQEHDKRKKILCEKNGISLIYFEYTDEICEQLVKERLKEYI